MATGCWMLVMMAITLMVTRQAGRDVVLWIFHEI